MSYVIPFKPSHINCIDPQFRQISNGDATAGDLLAQDLYLKGPAFSYVRAGHVYGSGGVFPTLPGCGRAWAILDRGAGRYLRPITQATRRFLQCTSFVRIELDCAVDFKEANQWALLLGFQLEGVMRKYLNGVDHNLYSRIK